MSIIEIHQKGKCVMTINDPSHSIGVHGYMDVPKTKLEVKRRGGDEMTEYCKCYEKGNQPPLLTDWRKTNICQTCGKIHKEKMMTSKKDFWRWITNNSTGIGRI